MKPTYYHLAERIEDETPSEARELATESIRRMLIWIADAPSLQDRGLRATVALKCLRPDLINWATFAKIGDENGCSRQYVHHLGEEFRVIVGHHVAP